MEPMINNGDNRKEKRIISEPTPVDLDVVYNRQFPKRLGNAHKQYVGIY